MTFASLDGESSREPARRLAHVRWVVGGTGAGKSTVTGLLGDVYDVEVYRGDRAEPGWVERCTPQYHPHLAALRDLPVGGMWRDRSAEQVFRAMPGLYGETVGFVVDDLLGLPGDRVVLVDYFGILPGHLAPLLLRSSQAVFLLPTPEFRRNALAARYADTARARANWGSEDPAGTFAKRLVRDALWDDEVRRQAAHHGLEVTLVDGAASATDLAAALATRFGLEPGVTGQPVG
jgi:hypothetical protein